MELKDCNLCKERSYGKGPVAGEGNKDLAQVCILGRNPGKTEDIQGKPFVGKAGQKLNQGLVLAGLIRVNCYITNVVKCMTPTNVSPSVNCQKMCREKWLNDEMKSLKRLRLVLTLGNHALQYFEPLARVGELHGYSFLTDKPWGEGRIRIFVSYHPSAALRNSVIDDKFRKDMLKLKELLPEVMT